MSTRARLLDILIPQPRLLERNSVELAAPPERVWPLVRHLDFGRLALVRALFLARTLPAELGVGKKRPPLEFTIDSLGSTLDKPGFQILGEEPNRELTVGAIGKVWHVDIPFVHVPDAEAFARYDDADEVKVAWAIALEPRGDAGTLLTFEVRVDATDEEAWKKFRRYFRFIGPGSHFIRRALLRSLARELGTPPSREDTRALPGDDMLHDAAAQATHFIDIDAPPEGIWPWLVQMGCGRAGFYSWDILDNGNVPSAREVHPELQDIQVGDVLPASPKSKDGFEVLRIDQPNALVLGGLFDPDANEQLPFDSARPRRFWHVTWAFALERLDAKTTRLHVRGRAAIPEDSGRFHLAWVRPVHAFMEHAQLAHLKARVEAFQRKRGDGERSLQAST